MLAAAPFKRLFYNLRWKSFTDSWNSVDCIAFILENECCTSLTLSLSFNTVGWGGGPILWAIHLIIYCWGWAALMCNFPESLHMAIFLSHLPYHTCYLLSHVLARSWCQTPWQFITHGWNISLKTCHVMMHHTLLKKSKHHVKT